MRIEEGGHNDNNADDADDHDQDGHDEDTEVGHNKLTIGKGVH